MIKDLKEAIKFLRRHSKALKIALLVFLVGAIFGFMEYTNALEYRQFYEQIFEQSVGRFSSSEGAELAKGIFFNNIRASVLGLCSGILPFIFFPVINIAGNGITTGAAIASVSIATGKDAGSLVLLGILPHGIFEITALVVAIALGITLCKNITKALLRKPHEKIAELLDETARCYVLVVLPLIFIAAVVETYITPMLLG